MVKIRLRRMGAHKKPFYRIVQEHRETDVSSKKSDTTIQSLNRKLFK